MTEHDKVKNGTTTWQEIAYSNMIHLETLTRLLIDKGLITKEAFLEEVQKAQDDIRRREEQISSNRDVS